MCHMNTDIAYGDGYGYNVMDMSYRYVSVDMEVRSDTYSPVVHGSEGAQAVRGGPEGVDFSVGPGLLHDPVAQILGVVCVRVPDGEEALGRGGLCVL
jgi:hypothetical protein